MDLGKSLRHAMVNRDFTAADVGELTGFTTRFVLSLRKREHWDTSTLKEVTDIFDMSVDEFIALGNVK